VLGAGGYCGYIILSYDRIGDVSLEVEKHAIKEKVTTDQIYSVSTYNIGFGAYNQDYSFFMDEGYMKDGSYVTFPGKIDGDRKDIFTEIVLPNEQAILSTGHNLINVEKKTDGVTAEDFIKALYNDEEINQLKDYDGDRLYEELPKIQGIYFQDGKYIIIDLEHITCNIRKSSVCFIELPDGQLMDLELDKLITIRTKKDGYTAEDILKSMFGEDVEYTYLNSGSKEKTKVLK
jgi:hypothetical protein